MMIITLTIYLLARTDFRAFTQQKSDSRAKFSTEFALKIGMREINTREIFYLKKKLLSFVLFLLSNTNLLYLVLFFLTKSQNINETPIKTYFLKIF